MYTRRIALLIALLPCLLYAKQRWSGDYYNENSDPQYQAALSVLKNTKLGNYKSILDIGCGSGKITKEIMRMFPHATIEAIDASEDMVQAARKKYRKLSKRVSFNVEDAQNLSYKDTFDLVVSFSCIHWIKDKKALFEGIAQALKPNGTVLIVGCAKSDTNPISRAILDLKERLPWSLFLANVNPDTQFFPLEKIDIEHTIKHAGLEPVEITETFFPLLFKNKNSLTNWIVGWLGGVSALANLTEEHRKAFAQTVAEYYSSLQPPAKDGSIKYEWPLIIVKAQKPSKSIASSHAQSNILPEH